jgi:putative DNA primase/helicase
VTSYPDGRTASFGHSLPLPGSNGPTNGQARNLTQVSILDIHAALGGKVSPHSIGKPWIVGTCWGPHPHGTDRYNLRLNDSDGVWSCHCGGKGGKLKLIIFAGEARDPKSAWRWLIGRGLVAEREHRNGVEHHTTAMFEYHNEDGSQFARVDRVEPGRNGKPKDFYPRLWEGTGYAIRSKLNGKKLPLYRLPEVRQAIEAGERLFLTEGEGKGDKLREALEAAKIVGAVTTIPGGCGAPLTDEHLHQLRGLKSAVILADSDTSGRAAARLRAERIVHKLGVEVKVLDLYPEATTKEHPAWAWDVADFLKDGGKVEQLLTLIDSAPLFTLSAAMVTETETRVERGDEGKREVYIEIAAAIIPREPQFLIYPYFPKGESTWVEGARTSGKTFVVLDLAARVTRGDSFNGEPIAQGNVAIITAEDSLDHTIMPRLVAAKADLNRVFFIRTRTNGRTGSPSFATDIRDIHRLLRDQSVCFLIVDGSFGILNVQDSKSYEGSYQAMTPVIELVRDLNIVNGMLRHVRKQKGSAIDSGMGSVGYGAQARSTLTVARPSPTAERRVLAHTCVTNAVQGPSLSFTIEGFLLDGFDRPTGRVVWGGEAPETADDLTMAEPQSADERSAIDEAKVTILEALAEGEITAATLKACVLDQDITRITFDRARGDLKKEGVIEKTGGGVAGPVMWRKTSHESIETQKPHSHSDTHIGVSMDFMSESEN